MEIKVLGTGCPKCNKLEDLVNEVLKEKGIEASVEKVTDVGEIAETGIMMTPGLMINGEVKLSGKLPSKEKLSEIISSG